MTETNPIYLTENTFYHSKNNTYQFQGTVTYGYEKLAILQDVNSKAKIALEISNFTDLIERGVYRESVVR